MSVLMDRWLLVAHCNPQEESLYQNLQIKDQMKFFKRKKERKKKVG